MSTISDPWNCHIEFPNTIDVFLKRKSYLDFLIHAWKIIKSEDLVYHVFMFQFLTIIDQFSCFCSQYYGILSRGEKKLDFLFYLVLQVHRHITIQYSSRAFHILIFPSSPWVKLAKKWEIYLNIRKGVANFFSDSDTYHTISTYVKTLATT